MSPSSTIPTRAGGPDTATEVLPARHPGRWVAAAVATLMVAAVLGSLARNPAVQWDVVAHYFMSRDVLSGLGLTLWLTTATMGLGFTLGIALAGMRLSANPVLRGISWGYTWVFRSIPLLVQLLFWFNIGALYPVLSIGLPFAAPLVSVNTTHLVGSTGAALIGLTLHEAAYASEVVRGGLQSVDHGQLEAGQALGMSRLRVLRRVVLPQAMRSIVPAAGNMLIGTLKGTSIVSVIAVQDLTYSVQLVYNRNYLIIPLLVVATLWYAIVTTVLTTVQYYVERHYARGDTRHSPPTAPQLFLARLRKALARGDTG